MTISFLNIPFETIECAKCHILFAITQDHDNRLRKSKEDFWCPSGHTQVYTGESSDTIERRLREEIRDLEKKLQSPKRKKKS